MLREQEFGNKSVECADAYYTYGRALLELHRSECTVLGDAIPQGDPHCGGHSCFRLFYFYYGDFYAEDFITMLKKLIRTIECFKLGTQSIMNLNFCKCLIDFILHHPD